MTPRGIRNNNPLNIERSKDKWQGMSPEQTDSRFVVFSSMTWGLRAAFIIIRNYLKRPDVNSVSDIISRWAPSSENNTARYIELVCLMAGVKADQALKFESKLTMCRVVRAMAIVECGCFYAHLFPLEIFKQAYEMVS